MLRLRKVTTSVFIKHGNAIFNTRALSIPSAPRYCQSHTPKDNPITPAPSANEKKELVDDKKKAIEKTSGGTLVMIMNGLSSAGSSLLHMARNPGETWKMIKTEAHHYWVGSKLLWVEIGIASQIVSRIAKGHGMTRRERIQLIRTTMDLFRLVPFAIFVIVPFMEFLLPFALKIFPNMLPSTFQDSLKKEENMKRELHMRIAVADFMQETFKEMAKLKQKSADGESSGALEVIDFMEKARLGEPLSNESVIKIARLFKDELTLANVSRPQLVSMCRYMGLPPYGADAFLRFQLRAKLSSIKEDDRRILWEGINSLTTDELREACSNRGMRSIGMTSFGYRRQLQEWLDLSIQKNIPISLLIMSRAFSLSSSSPEDVLKSSIQSLDSDIINEVVLAVAKPGEENSIDMQTRKLESMQFQKELIEDEREEQADAKASATKKDKQHVAAAPQLAPPEAREAAGAEVAHAASAPSETTSLTTASPAANANADTGAAVSLAHPTDLSADEMQAIGDLTRGSSVEREKAQLAILEASVDAVAVPLPSPKDEPGVASAAGVLKPVIQTVSNAAIPATTATTKSEPVSHIDKNDVAPTVAPTPSQEDKSLLRMQNALNSMLGSLKKRIDSTEKALGDNLKLLDKDNDGELSTEELKEAIIKILKKDFADKDVDEMVQKLDRDKDGRISVQELLAFVEEKRAKREVEALEVSLPAAAHKAP